MTALAPTATDRELTTWLVENVTPDLLANLLVVFLDQDIQRRDGLLEELAQVWQLRDPKAWLQFSDWAAHRAGT